MRVPFSPPRMDQKIIDEVVDTLKSGWITTGPKTRLFEKKLTEYGGHKATLCTSSGSAGLELMLHWFGVSKGDEVIVPAYTYSATANVVEHCGAKPVCVDVNRDFNISVDEIRKAVTKKTKVIMPVDLAGFPCDYDEINALVEEKKIKRLFRPRTAEQRKLGRILVLSDAAHSIGAIYKGKRTGSLTDISVYSFHAVKNLTTAEGGAVCLNLPEPFDNDTLQRELAVKALHGQTKDAFTKTQAGNWQYDVVEAGYKYNMTDIQASMGLVELERYDRDMLTRRRQIFDRYSSKLSGYQWAELPPYEDEMKKSSYHVYLLRIKNIDEPSRNRIMASIFKKDVAVNVHFIPLPLLSHYKDKGYDIKNYPVSYDNYAREISLPVYYDLTNDMTDYVLEVVIKSVEENI